MLVGAEDQRGHGLSLLGKSQSLGGKECLRLSEHRLQGGLVHGKRECVSLPIGSSSQVICGHAEPELRQTVRNDEKTHPVEEDGLFLK